MKTPREILFARHRGAEPKLDEIRRRTLATLPTAGGVDGLVRANEAGRPVSAGASGHRARDDGGLAIRLAQLIWHELIRPCRRTWAGLAAVWAILLAVHLGTTSAAVAVPGRHPARSAAAVRSFVEEQRMLAELLQPTPPPPAEPPRSGPRPRSDRTTATKMV